jgi:hypothetical protein
MKKLVAARPIQYMGRTYESGDAVPAYDGKMVEAWLAAGSVKWTGADVAEPEVKPTVNPDAQAADALRAMGLCITDDAGNFVGAENLAEQIRNTLSTPDGNGQEGAQEGAQGDGNGQDKEPDDGQSGAQGGQQAAGGAEMVAGHLDAAQLESMTKANLEKLAAEMGVKVTKNMTKAEIAALIAAEPVQAPKDENGGAQ